MKLETTSADFNDEQKRYLEGFMSGVQVGRAGRNAGLASGSSAMAAEADSEPIGPDAAGLKAQDKLLRDSKKLSDPEKFKREQHPFDAYERLKEQSKNNASPSPADNFRWRYYGLFYVAPAQDSFMCRLRIPNGILKHWQLAGLADLADRLAGGYAHVTTRANFQLREIPPKHTVALIEGIQDIGLCSRGSGADNIRNVTGTPTAGIDPVELIDTRDYAREWHYHILNDRSLTGLPRKFNVAFDGAGKIAVLEDTNDIAFRRRRVKDGFGAAPGVLVSARDRRHYRTQGFCQGNRHHRPAGRRHHGGRRHRAGVYRNRRSYQSAEGTDEICDRRHGRGKIPARGRRPDMASHSPECRRKRSRPRPAFDRLAHIGVHKQKQTGLNWLGVVLPVGKLTCEQMRGLAKIARDLGDGDIRLTVWQNLLISGVANDKVALAIGAIKSIGLAVEASSIRAGLVACTGNAGCKFAASDTKRHAVEIGDWCETRVPIETPVNIHLTGCHHSCAQHYIGDIGLIAAKVPGGNEDDTVEGYHLFAGGGFGPDAGLGKEIYHDVKAEDAPKAVERLLKAYIANRASTDETFLAFSRRHNGEDLRKMADAESST